MTAAGEDRNPATDPIRVLRDALDVLYHYTSDLANPPGEGRSQTRADGKSALAQVEQLVDTARVFADNYSEGYRRENEIAALRAALRPFTTRGNE